MNIAEDLRTIVEAKKEGKKIEIWTKVQSCFWEIEMETHTFLLPVIVKKSLRLAKKGLCKLEIHCSKKLQQLSEDALDNYREQLELNPKSPKPMMDILFSKYHPKGDSKGYGYEPSPYGKALTQILKEKGFQAKFVMQEESSFYPTRTCPYLVILWE